MSAANLGNNTRRSREHLTTSFKVSTYKNTNRGQFWDSNLQQVATIDFLQQLVPDLVASAIAGLFVYFWRKKLKSLLLLVAEIFRPSRLPIKSIQPDVQVNIDKTLYNNLKHSTVFFSERFAKAFPGCRGLCDFSEPKKALDRLDILLKAPITASMPETRVNPIWWFRGGSALHIDSYRRIRKFLRLSDEFIFDEIILHKMKRLVAYGSNSYYRCFVYVEVENNRQSGLYDLSHQIARKGYAHEEFGIYGKFKSRSISRDDLDDGATTVNGRPIDLSGKVKLRATYVGKYNFLIAPHSSPINCKPAERNIELILDAILKNEASIQTLVDLIDKLPKNSHDF